MQQNTHLLIAVILFSIFLYSCSDPVPHVKSSKPITFLSEYRTRAFKLSYAGKNREAAHLMREARAEYPRAFESTDYYNVACFWALAGEIDSAFTALRIAVSDSQEMNYRHFLRDEDLISLHERPEWVPILRIVRDRRDKKIKRIDTNVVYMLDTVLLYDQLEREKIEPIEKKYGLNSRQMKELWEVINRQDALNLKNVTRILDTYGWLGEDVVGFDGNNALFLVIQHADQATQEKYLPMMREAARTGRAHPVDLAYLEDRVALGQGKKQWFGSQVEWLESGKRYIVSPMEDPANVDKRRAGLQMGKLENYVKRWDIKWSLKQYEKDLLEWEAANKTSTGKKNNLKK